MDPNTALVFESIGLIKKSLQCSICLDLFNDPHSTRCNHQFCSRCIRKVVDESKDRKKEALCPLCKNPITKRSLTSNPKLKEIVDVVGKLNIAFQEDAGLPDSPYPLVNSKLNGESKSYLQFARLNPTPLKPAKLTSPKLGGATTEQLLNSCLNHQSSKYGLRSRRGQPGPHEKPTSAQVVSNKQRSTGMEILSLLESQEDIQPEAPAEPDESSALNMNTDEEVDIIGNETLQGNCRKTDSPNTRRTSQPTESQFAKSQENVNTANTRSSGSLTIDAGKSTQSSVISNNSVSMLDGLLSQESTAQRNNGVDAEDGEDTEEEEPHHSFTVNKQNISKSSPVGENANSPLSERVTGNCTSSNNMFNEVQKSPKDNHELRTPEVVCMSKSKPSPRNVKKSNLVDETCEQYSSERVPASVDSDSQSYRVIPLPRYQQSDDEISPEFHHNPHAVLAEPDQDHCSDEITYSTAEKISSQVEPCLSSEKQPREPGDAIQTEKPKVAPSAENVFRAENCENSEVLIFSASGSSRHPKRKHSDEENSSCRKYQRLNNERQVTSIDNKTCQNSLVKNRRTNLGTNQLNSAKKVGKRISNQLPAHSNVGYPEVENPEVGDLEVGDPEVGGPEVGDTEVDNPEVGDSKLDNPEIENPSHDQNCSPPHDSDDVIPPTPPERTDLECTSPKKTNTSTLGYTRLSRTSRSKLGEVEEVFGKDEDSIMDDGDSILDDGGPILDDGDSILDDGGPIMDDGGSILDDDQIYSSQEDLLFRENEHDDQDNVALLRRLAPTLSCHKESEMESDDDTGDCKADDTTSISSLTDGDGVEVSSQRITYLHKVLAQTGGEIEKLTTDLKNLKENDVIAQPVQLKHDHVDIEKENVRMNRDDVRMNRDDMSMNRDDVGMNNDDLRMNRNNMKMSKDNIRINKDDIRVNKDNIGVNKDDAGTKRVNVRMNRNDVRMNRHDDVENDSSTDKEKDFDSDKENNTRDSDCDSSSGQENENIETLDKENKAEVMEGTDDLYGKENENDVKKNGNDEDFSSDQGQENEHAGGDRDDKDDDDDHESAGGDRDDKDDDDDHDDDMDNDSDDDHDDDMDNDGDDNHDHDMDNDGDDDHDDDMDNDGDDDVEILDHCSLSPPPSLELSTLKLTKLPAAIKNMQRLLESEDELDDTDYSSRSYLALGGNQSEVDDVFENKRSNDAPASKARCHGSPRVDTSADVQIMKTGEGRLAGSQKENDAELKFPPRRSRDTCKEDVRKYRGTPDSVLVELRVNPGPKQRTLTTMLGNSLSHEVRKEPRNVTPSVCFVVTRLPKQFVSLAGYLAKQNDGNVSADVTEETTHVIMPTDSKMYASRKNYTIKYLLGIALGKWIVSQLWITASVKSGRLIDEKQYEVKGDAAAGQSHVPSLARTTRENKGPFLFDGISVVCFGEFSGAISQEHVCQLVRYCGGQVIDFSKELLKFSSTMSDLIIICDTILSENKELQIKDMCRRYSTFPVSSEWVTDSVANYQLQDIGEYRMDI